MNANATPAVETDRPAGRAWAAWALAFALVAVSAIYLMQVRTPLRMNTDAIAYLRMAASHNDGHGYLLRPGDARYPTGYPAMVAAMERFGVASSAGFVAANELMLAASACVGAWIIRRWLGLSRAAVLGAFVLLLLSRCTIRYVTIPGSEFAYLLLSTLCLACLTCAVRQPAARTGRALSWCALAIAFLSATWFRSVGVVLVPAIGWSLVQIAWQRRRDPVPLREWVGVHRSKLTVAAIVAIVGGCVLAVLASRTTYVHEATAEMGRHGLARELAWTLKQRMIDGASILTNVWRRELDYRGQRLLLVAGAVALPLILLVIARRVPHLGPVDVYLIGYVAVLLVWPYKADNRFWLPIQLFVYALLVREALALIDRRKAWARPVGVAWVLAYAVVGVGVLRWTTGLTFAGRDFSERYDLEFMRDAYRAASHDGRPTDVARLTPDLLPMIQRYGRPQFGP